MFNHDDFINKPCQSIFGRPVIYTPAEGEASFNIIGDFHEAYMDIDLKNSGADISSAEIILVVRLIDFPENYPIPRQGDFLTIDCREYQILDVQPHIPGSRKLVLHEAEP